MNVYELWKVISSCIHEINSSKINFSFKRNSQSDVLEGNIRLTYSELLTCDILYSLLISSLPRRKLDNSPAFSSLSIVLFSSLLNNSYFSSFLNLVERPPDFLIVCLTIIISRIDWNTYFLVRAIIEELMRIISVTVSIWAEFRNLSNVGTTYSWIDWNYISSTRCMIASRPNMISVLKRYCNFQNSD